MQETELRLSDLCVLLLRKWRSLVIVGVVLGLILGAGSVALRLRELNDPVELERMQAEYEVAYSQYWDAIEAVDRKIRNNENHVEQALIDLEDLSRVKENYEYDIEDLMADIEYAGLKILDMEKNIEVLELEKEQLQYRLTYANEQNENSLFMAIDPYDVKTSEIFIRVDSGYQIIPGSTYQDPDPTDELLQTYRLLVNNAEFYEKMIADLEMDTEVRYLTELISVVQYNSSALRIRVIGSDETMTLKMAEYIRDAILNSHSAVASAVGDHTVEVYSSRNYAVVDIDVYNEQQSNLMAATDLEGTIRDLDATILNVESAIRQRRADIRDYEDKIKDKQTAISELPVKEEALNSAIASYRDSINQLRLERLDLLRSNEPTEPGMSVKGAVVRFVKGAVIGGLVGIVLAAVWLVLSHVLGNKVMSAKHATAALNAGNFGTWPASKANKKKTVFAQIGGAVDRLAERIVGTAKADTAFVCANIVAAAGNQSILLCGGAGKDRIESIAAELKKNYPNLVVTAAGSVCDDPEAVAALAACDGLVLVEQVYHSNMSDIEQTWERAHALEKKILGVVMV